MSVLDRIRLRLIMWLWQFEFVRKHFCWASAVGWAFYGIWPLRKVETECDYCTACKDGEG